MAKTVVAFDAYGTLLSTAGIADHLSKHFPSDTATELATVWRKHQLEYTWRLNSMNQYRPFSAVTASALYNALSELSLTLPQADYTAALAAYDALPLFPDAEPCLSSLAGLPNITPVVFTNGTERMTAAALGHTGLRIVSIDAVERFKPAPESYQHFLSELSVEAGQVWLVSSNAFDIVGAHAMGMRTVWVDRAGRGWEDGCVEEARPDVVVRGLGQVRGVVVE